MTRPGVAVVTGASGFIGGALLAALEARGWTSVGVSRSGKPVTGAASYQVDLETDRQDFRDLIADLHPQAVFHLAMDKPGNAFEQSLDANLAMLRTVQEALAGQPTRLLIPGSAAQYGTIANTDLAIREDVPLQPVSPYGRVKTQLEQAALAGDPAPVWLRSFNTMGPGQPEGYPVADWARRIVALEHSGGGTLNTGRLDLVRDFLDVRDVADAYVDAISLAPGTVVNVCSGRGTQLQSLVNTLIGMAETTITVQPEAPTSMGAAPLAAIGDPTRLKTLTGWEPRFSIDDSLRDTLAWARQKFEAKDRA